MAIHLADNLWHALCLNEEDEDDNDDDIKKVTCKNCLLVHINHLENSRLAAFARLKELFR